jgi:hypothetical protein
MVKQQSLSKKDAYTRSEDAALIATIQFSTLFVNVLTQQQKYQLQIPEVIIIIILTYSMEQSPS